MKCEYINCRLRANEDLCNLRAELCRMYSLRKRNEAQIREIEARFGEIQPEDIKRVYRDSFEEFPV